MNSDKVKKSAVSCLGRRLLFWFRQCVPSGVALLVLAVIVGCLTGIGAWFLKFSISHLSSFLLGFVGDGDIIWYIVGLPVVGIMLTVCYQQFVAHQSLEHGTSAVIADLKRQQYVLSSRLCYRPLVASVLTLGFGGSAGAEGPIATAGASIGSYVARVFGVSPDMTRVLIGCGAGAGIAGIFKAPVGGMLFSLEVLKVKLDSLSVLTLVVASICGSLTCYMLTGFSFDIQFLPKSFFNPHHLGWVALLGLACGCYSIYYNKITALLHKFFRSISNVWIRALFGSLILGACLLLFPAMYGEGYGTITDIINGNTTDFVGNGVFAHWHSDERWLILLAFGVMMLKVFATISTNSSGGVAGDFAPTIFAGAFVGMVFAEVVNLLFDANLPVPLFALFATAGTFAGIIHAPLMAMFLVPEMMGNGFGFFLPMALTSAVSYITVKIFTPHSKYVNANHDDVSALLKSRSTSHC